MSIVGKTTRGGGKGVAWLRANAGHRGDGCLQWPFAAPGDGYGMFGFNGKLLYAHRFMCELAHGKAPSRRHQAAHSCGRGDRGCVNPRHISWKTPKQNQGDRRWHGTHNRQSKRGKLTYFEAEKIKALRGKKTQAELAVMFNTSRSNIGYVQRKTWRKALKGVITYGKKFKARLKIGSKYKFFGPYDTAEEAAVVYRTKTAALRT